MSPRILVIWELPAVACEEALNVTHSISCNNSGFASVSHSDVANIVVLLDKRGRARQDGGLGAWVLYIEVVGHACRAAGSGSVEVVFQGWGEVPDLFHLVSRYAGNY